MENLPGHIGRLRLLALSIEFSTYLTERLSACPRLQVRTLNVIPRMTIRIVVMDSGIDCVPRFFLRHCFFLSHCLAPYSIIEFISSQ